MTDPEVHHPQPTPHSTVIPTGGSPRLDLGDAFKVGPAGVSRDSSVPTSVPRTTQHRIGATIEQWINAAIDKGAGKDTFRWELGVMPYQPAPGAVPEPTMVLMMYLNGAVIGEPIVGMCPLPNPILTKEIVDELVPSYMEHLRTERSKTLAG